MAGRAAHVTALLLIDRFALFFMGLIFAAAFIVTVLSYDYRERHGPSAGVLVRTDFQLARARPSPRREEYYILLLLAVAGAAVLVCSVHFASFFLGLELLSVSLYALMAYSRTHALGIEAGVKYLILAGTSSAFLLFGMALVYADLGTLEFPLRAAIPSGGPARSTHAGRDVPDARRDRLQALARPVPSVGAGCLPGAPAPVTAFVATVSKGAVFASAPAVLHRRGPPATRRAFRRGGADRRRLDVRRQSAGPAPEERQAATGVFLHRPHGIPARGVAGGRTLGQRGGALLFLAYFVTMLGALGIVAGLSTGEKEAESMDDYRGLAWRRPWPAAIFSLMLFSLAGIPITAGFVGKFFVLAAGVNANLWWLVVALAVNSAIGLFYYLRIIVVMYQPADEGDSPLLGPVPAPSLLVLSATALLLLWLGVYPAPAVRAIQVASLENVADMRPSPVPVSSPDAAGGDSWRARGRDNEPTVGGGKADSNAVLWKRRLRQSHAHPVETRRGDVRVVQPEYPSAGHPVLVCSVVNAGRIRVRW